MVRKKVLAIIDLPSLVNGSKKWDFFSFSKNIKWEADEIRTFMKIPREVREEKDIWGLVRMATKAGLFPTLCISDPDQIVTREIQRVIERRRDIKKMILVAGDNGYSEIVWDVKRAGIKTKVLIPLDNDSQPLKDVADEIATISEYAKEYEPRQDRKESERFQNAAEGKEVVVEA